ncbi:hypothetical protein ACLD0W_03880 [Alloalcanivorax sp. C16-1]|uniref:hypothetical protein n=1 Tax=Alloalcanivorax sp. C16-1 TaxID=3390051 RepID=UPI0039707F63
MWGWDSGLLIEAVLGADVKSTIKKAVILFFGVPGTLIYLPALALFLVACLQLFLPFETGWIGRLWETSDDRVSLYTAFVPLFLVIIGGFLGLMGFWCWALADRETAGDRKLIFISCSCVAGAASMFTVLLYSGDFDTYFGIYSLAGAGVGLGVAVVSLTELARRRSRPNSPSGL